ncbi:MAG: carbohydrate porin [Burkholderiales bacterium]|nr:carbohydrate porin [Burkholderiales bacterium]
MTLVDREAFGGPHPARRRARRAWRLVVAWLPLLGAIAAQPAWAQSPAPTSTPTPTPTPADTDRPSQNAPNFDARFQATYIWQRKTAFAAAYSGPNSLSTDAEKSYTFSATAYLGLRLAPGTELYVNPEVIQGVPLSNLQGLGSPTNGEIQKVAGSNPKLYLPRLFVRQTWGLGGGSDSVDAAQNQLSGTRDKRRLVLTAGKFAVTDVFDANAYSHDARSQFMTWASLAQGPYDFVADSQGYTWGASLEYVHDDWALRVGRFVAAQESNGQSLNFAIGRYHGDQIEVEHAHRIGGQPGVVRVLFWSNRESMGRFADAIDYAQRHGGVPDVANVRAPHHKHGYGLHLEQALSDDVGAFVRYGWGDGQTETYSFEEVERSAQAGLSIKGASWGRGGDTVGLLALRNGLSAIHQRYLAQGGLGFFIGDGRLNYRPEQIVEAYYSYKLCPQAWLSADYQHIVNPAYNADRGPVNVYGLRLHAEF